MRTLITQQILGLDIGSSSVKAVAIRKGLMGLEWAGGYQVGQARPQTAFDWGKKPLPGLKEWIAEQGFPTERVVVSVPAHLISIRTLTLPFSDPRRLEKVVPFELESLLPYPIEEVVVDYQVTGAVGGKTSLLVAAIPRDLLKNYLEHLAEAGIDPETVDLDGMALIDLARNLPAGETGFGPDENGMTAVLDMGASKTVVCLMHHGQVHSIRTVLLGGQNLTEALQNRHGISFEEAEDLKSQAGLMDEDVESLHQRGISETLRRTLDPLLGELGRIFHAYQADGAIGPTEGGKAVTGFLLCGGGSKLKGLESYLASELGIRAMNLTPGITTGNGARWDPVYGLGLGLALKGARLSGGSRMNFRKGEFSYRGERSAVSTRSRYLWIAALVVAALAAADLYMKYSIKMSRYQTLKNEVREQFQTMFPETRNIVDEVQQAQTAVAELEKRSNLFGRGGWTSLQIMAELTRRMPPNVKIEVQDLVIEPGRLRLEAETDTFDSVDKIKASLEQFEVFKDVTISDAKVSANQSRVRFRLNATLVSKERT